MTNNNQSLGNLLSLTTRALRAANITTARLDSLIILEDILDKDRVHLLAHPELMLTDSQLEELQAVVAQRKKHVPLAYIRGKAMFYGRMFYVDQNTLVPRPESEDVITILKEHLKDTAAAKIADVGTGSGCLGLTAALEIQGSSIDLYDIDRDVLDVSRKNAEQLGVTVSHYFQEDLLSEAGERTYNAVLANLPYVPDAYRINQDAEFEPRLALFAGSDGLDAYRAFWRQLKGFITRPTHVLTESLPGMQHDTLIQLAASSGYTIRESSGFVQLFSL